MTSYRVRWEIDIEADSPEDAAAEALAIQRDEGSIATFFRVFLGVDGLGLESWQNVDLTPEEDCPSNHWNDGTDACADCGAFLN